MLKRILTAGFLLPLILLILWIGKVTLLVTIILFFIIIIYEIYFMVRNIGLEINKIIYSLWALFTLLYAYFSQNVAWQYRIEAFGILVFSGLVLLFMSSMYKPRTFNLKIIFMPIIVIVSLTLCFSHLFFFDQMIWDEGRKWIYLVLLSVIANDTASMFIGKLIGKHKLFPQVSPNKTWEGLFGGVLFAIFTCFLLNIILSINLSILQIGFFSLIVAFCAHFGDFLESLLKRKTKVKDSGNILPGHGGILDRIDSIALNIPVTYYFFIFWGIGD